MSVQRIPAVTEVRVIEPAKVQITLTEKEWLNLCTFLSHNCDGVFCAAVGINPSNWARDVVSPVRMSSLYHPDLADVKPTLSWRK